MTAYALTEDGWVGDRSEESSAARDEALRIYPTEDDTPQNYRERDALREAHWRKAMGLAPMDGS